MCKGIRLWSTTSSNKRVIFNNAISDISSQQYNVCKCTACVCKLAGYSQHEAQCSSCMIIFIFVWYAYAWSRMNTCVQ